MNSRYEKAILLRYVKAYEELLGEGIMTPEEFDYILTFADISTDSKSKDMLYDTVFRLKRWYPKFLILWFLKRDMKSYFEKSGASDNIKKVKNKYSELIFNHAYRMYCRGSVRY